jgi:hypothetical protein
MKACRHWKQTFISSAKPAAVGSTLSLVHESLPPRAAAFHVPEKPKSTKNAAFFIDLLKLSFKLHFFWRKKILNVISGYLRKEWLYLC